MKNLINCWQQFCRQLCCYLQQRPFCQPMRHKRIPIRLSLYFKNPDYTTAKPMARMWFPDATAELMTTMLLKNKSILWQKQGLVALKSPCFPTLLVIPMTRRNTVDGVLIPG